MSNRRQLGPAYFSWHRLYHWIDIDWKWSVGAIVVRCSMMWFEGVIMIQPHQRYRHPRYKKKYRVTNWSSYDRSLVNRGDVTLWLSEEVLQSWSHCSKQTFGRPKLYSDLAIETALSLRLVFKLPLLPRKQMTWEKDDRYYGVRLREFGYRLSGGELAYRHSQYFSDAFLMQ